MPPAAPDAASSLGAGIARRWREIDPLLPSPDPGSPHCGAPLAVAGDGGIIAAGRCEHWAGAPGSLDLSWGADPVLAPSGGDDPAVSGDDERRAAVRRRRVR